MKILELGKNDQLWQQMEKTASVRGKVPLEAGRLLQIGALLAGGGAIIGAAHQAGAHAIGKMTEKAREKTRHQRYAAVLKADPSLKEEPLAPKYFAVLDRASPYVAGEPYIAAATIQTMVNTPSLREGSVPAVTPKALQEILNTEKARQETRFPMFNTNAPGSQVIRDVGARAVEGS